MESFVALLFLCASLAIIRSIISAVIGSEGIDPKANRHAKNGSVLDNQEISMDKPIYSSKPFDERRRDNRAV